jgi:hypothetical protein
MKNQSESLKSEIRSRHKFINFDLQMIAMAKEGEISNAMEFFEHERPAEFLREHKKMLDNLNSIWLLALDSKKKN